MVQILLTDISLTCERENRKGENQEKEQERGKERGREGERERESEGEREGKGGEREAGKKTDR